MGGTTISMLTGDFLAPYLLSSFDKGLGMMSMLNKTPIDYLTWGNHEHDLDHADVMKREREYKGVWINSNMQSYVSFKDSTCQVQSDKMICERGLSTVKSSLFHNLYGTFVIIGSLNMMQMQL